MSEPSRYYLGIDAGGTKTHALIADQRGRVYGMGRAGRGNWEGVGLEGAYQALSAALHQALAAAGLQVQELCAAGYGLAGLDWSSDEARLRPIIHGLGVSGPNLMVNDAFAALYAGSVERVGVALIAGTGNTVAGRNRQGELFRTFGLGPVWGDVGGAGDFVRLALTAIAYAYLGRGPETALTARLFAHYGVNSVPELAEQFSRGEGFKANGRAAPAIFEVAQQGDAVAQDIIRFVANELGANAVAVVRRLKMLNEPFDLVMAGGVFRARNQLLQETLASVVSTAARHARAIHLEAPPVVGGVLLALEAAGESISPQARQRLLEEAENYMEA